jgi:glycosyltransferase involved in cell wall biosynthesis
VKIAYLNPGGALGGAEMCLLDVLASLPTARPDATAVVILGEDGPLRHEVEAMGIACEVLPLPGGVARLGDAGATGLSAKLKLMARGFVAATSTVTHVQMLSSKLRSLKVNLIQSNGMKMHLLGTWSVPVGVPVIWHLHDYLGSRAAMARLLKLVARPGVSGVAVSRSVADDARATLGGRVPITAIYNAIDTQRFSPGPSNAGSLDQAAGLGEPPAGTVRVGLVATFATWKGHDVFLEAVAKVPTDRLARFYVVGGPIYTSTGSQRGLEDLKARAVELGVSHRVAFTGHQADPARVLRSLDVVVHASTRPEPFGRVIVEGMSCGAAVVAMNEGGAAELFVDGQDALGCTPRDPAALAQVITRLIDDATLRARIGQAGRLSVLTRFDRSRLGQEWAPIYNAAASSSANQFKQRPATVPESPAIRTNS